MRLNLRSAIAFFALQVYGYACPLCHGKTGEQVRAGIFDGHFARNAAALLSPFPVFAGIVAWIYFGGGKTAK